jgi:hypothetical protein
MQEDADRTFRNWEEERWREREWNWRKKVSRREGTWTNDATDDVIMPGTPQPQPYPSYDFSNSSYGEPSLHSSPQQQFPVYSMLRVLIQVVGVKCVVYIFT